MRRVTYLFLVLLTTISSYANADDAGAPGQASLKLYGGIAHRETLPSVDAALQKHREKREKLKLMEAITASPPQKHTDAPKVAELSKQVATKAETTKQETPKPETSKSEPLRVEVATKQPIAQPVSQPQQAALVKQQPVTAAYSPAFGVARSMSEPSHPVLKAEVAQQHYTVQWFMIPNWMGGTWEKDGDLTTEETDLRSGRSSYKQVWTENHLVSKWGHQLDSHGNVWHVNLLPAERDGMSAGKQVRFLAVAQECERTSAAADLMTRTHYVVSESNAWSGQPIDTFQQESLNHYTLSPSGQLVNSSSNRVFSYQGQPVRDGQLQSTFRKIANFTPTESMGGINLRQSLADYLQSIGAR